MKSNPYQKPHSGTGHFILQRLSAIILIPVVFYILYSVVKLVGQDSYQGVLQWFSSPFHSILFGLFVILAFYHGALGLQIIIEDYIANIKLRWILVLFSRLLAGFFTLIALIAIASLAGLF